MALDATGTPTTPDSIPKYNTAVDAPSGKGFNAAMDQLQVSLSARLGLDMVTIAGTRIFANKLLTADANQSFRIMGDGKHEWGAGGATALDTNLYRSAADLLKTDDELEIGFAGGKDTLRLTSTAADTGITIGGDVNLYRSAANYLKTDDDLLVGASSFQTGITTGVWLLGGGAVSVVRALAAQTTFYSTVNGDTQYRFTVDSDGKMLWGSGAAAGDTNLYRSAANTLKTDYSLEVTGSALLGTNNGNVAIGAAADAGGGIVVIAIKNRTTAPASTPALGGVLYVESGALKYKGSAGTVTTLAVA